MLHQDKHEWQPRCIYARFVGSHHLVWQETKAIHNDVAVNVIRVAGSELKTRRVKLRHRITSTPGLEIKAAPRGVHIFSSHGRYAGVHRFIGFSGKAKTRLIKDDKDASLEIELKIPHENYCELAFIVAAAETRPKRSLATVLRCKIRIRFSKAPSVVGRSLAGLI